MAGPLTILVDTNIIIPSEPTVGDGVPVNAGHAVAFCRHAANAQCRLYYHPVIDHDIDRDSDKDRARQFRAAVQRYNPLPNPPAPVNLPEEAVGTPEARSNAWVDNHLLAAVAGNAVDFLVTEDKGIHRKAGRLGLSPRVLNLADALNLVSTLFDKDIPPLPLVKRVKAHEISLADPIFQSLREDYSGFDNWFIKCQREQRDVYIIKSDESDALAAICIMKQEDVVECGPSGKTLKLCTFKVAEEGSLFGELLLKTVFDYALKNRYHFVYFTAFAEKQARLVNFAESFGFSMLTEKKNKAESIMCKQMIPSAEVISGMDSFDFYVAYGPFVTKFEGNNTYIIPIQPQWHRMLFPEFEKQGRLFDPRVPCGNSIKKIYLSHSRITQLRRGDNIAFYRSEDYKGITALGIIEDVYRSESPHDIAAFAGLRTVFSYAQITELCDQEVLAIKFRMIRFFDESIKLDELLKCGGLLGQPQSIHSLNAAAIAIIQQRIQEEDALI